MGKAEEKGGKMSDGCFFPLSPAIPPSTDVYRFSCILPIATQLTYL